VKGGTTPIFVSAFEDALSDNKEKGRAIENSILQGFAENDQELLSGVVKELANCDRALGLVE
jgi:hypothetical protein